MKWIKRIFHHQSEKEEKKCNNEQRTANELKTKVTYRYPERKFRFPVDLDRGITKIQNEIRKEKALLQTTPESRENSDQSNNKSSNFARSQDSPKSQLSSDQDIEKKPFRPTKLPPPFYKRKKQETDNEPVVFELTPFFSTEKTKSEKDLPFKNMMGTKSLQSTKEKSKREVEKSEHIVHHHKENLRSENSPAPRVSEAFRSSLDRTQQVGEAVDERNARNPFHHFGAKKTAIHNKRILDKQGESTFPGKTKKSQTYRSYQFPALSLLKRPIKRVANDDWIQKQTKILNDTFASFQVAAKVVGVTEGPRVTRFEIAPDVGVKVNKITNLTDEIKLSLAAKEIRIEAPIPGKHTIGIEVPNPETRPVFLREIMEEKSFVKAPSPLTVALGLDITGKPIIANLKEMPHGLIAGATGSGKSVAINTFIVSLLYKARPDEVKLLLIDPKMVELSPYNDIPHLICPVITNTKAATAALKWAVEEMERRYELFAKDGVRNIKRYNKQLRDDKKLPYIVIIIDELADLMMTAPDDVEETIARIAQKARACGIHLLIATQRPSVDVITGLIKANIPTRMAFSVSSQIDSRTILDTGGAERLLGMGDMLYVPNGSSKPIRIQGAFISDEEIERVVHFVRQQGEPQYLFAERELLQLEKNEEMDELFIPACEYAVEIGHISTSALQRKFRIGYNRAARLIDLMEEKGLVSGQKGGKPRDVFLNRQDLEKLKQTL